MNPNISKINPRSKIGRVLAVLAVGRSLNRFEGDVECRDLVLDGCDGKHKPRVTTVPLSQFSMEFANSLNGPGRSIRWNI